MDADPGETRSSLLGRLRAGGDDEAWREFDRRYRGLVIRYCLRRGLQIVDAEDVRQSVMIGLTRSLEKFRYDPARGRFRSYFGRVVHNAVSRFERTRRHEISLDEVGEVEAAATRDDDLWVDEWRIHHLKLALDAIRPMVEPESLRVFERLLDGQEVAEVAREFGMTEAGVHKVKQRIRDRLKALVAEQVRDEDQG